MYKCIKINTLYTLKIYTMLHVNDISKTQNQNVMMVFPAWNDRGVAQVPQGKMGPCCGRQNDLSTEVHVLTLKNL